MDLTGVARFSDRGVDGSSDDASVFAVRGGRTSKGCFYGDTGTVARLLVVWLGSGAIGSFDLVNSRELGTILSFLVD